MRRLRPTSLLVVAAVAAAISLTVASPASAYLPGNELMNTGDSLCLQPYLGSFAPGAAIVQVKCNANVLIQRWDQPGYNPSTGTFKVHNLATDLCLYAQAEGGPSDRTPIQQSECNGDTNEIWDENPPGSLRSRIAGTASHCLDVPEGKDTENLATQLWSCNGSGAQGWNNDWPDGLT